jgi:hypothetical protein
VVLFFPGTQNVTTMTSTGRKSLKKVSKGKHRQLVSVDSNGDAQPILSHTKGGQATTPVNCFNRVTVDEASGPCTVRTKSGDLCDCKKYSEEKSRNPHLPVTCRECGHGHSKHNSCRSVQGVVSIIRDVIGLKLGEKASSERFKAAQHELNEGF